MSNVSARPMFSPTRDMVRIAEACFASMAVEEHISSIVIEYQRKILSENEFNVRPEFVEKMAQHGGDPAAERILDPKISYLMPDSDFQLYAVQCDVERRKAGLSIDKEGQCPMLVAQDVVRLAKQELVDSLSHITGQTSETCIAISFKKYQELVELALKLYAPFVGTSSQILERLFGSGAPRGNGSSVVPIGMGG